MSLVRIHDFAVSLDGFGTGEGRSKDAPFGHAGERLHEWDVRDRLVAGGRRPRCRRRLRPAVRRRHRRGDHGRRERGYPGWHEAATYPGPWGSNPPFHTPVFVLTHHTGWMGTRFHFLGASPTEALDVAREAAESKDVRIGGGPTVIRDFLTAGLVDHMHVAVVPILLGRGASGTDWKAYTIESTTSPSGITHVTFTRA